MIGNRGQDILIPGETSASLSRLRTVWTSDLDYQTRKDTLREEIPVIDDGVRDYVFGGLGRDFNLANSNDLVFDRW